MYFQINVLDVAKGPSIELKVYQGVLLFNVFFVPEKLSVSLQTVSISFINSLSLNGLEGNLSLLVL